MTKFNRNNQSKLVNPFIFIGFGVIVALAAVILPLLISPDNEESLKWAIARTTLSAITIPIILVGFFYNTIQFQKTMAKPNLEVYFNKERNREHVIDLTEGKKEIELWVLNTGNAITELFQIDFYIPRMFSPTIDCHIIDSVTRYKEEANILVSFRNKHNYVCFVNIPIQISPLVIELHPQLRNYVGEYEISYRVFGDWAETQEGKLKIILKKREVSHAHS
jgi:hypothetical protein